MHSGMHFFRTPFSPQPAKLAERFSPQAKFQGFSPEGFSPQSHSSDGCSMDSYLYHDFIGVSQ